MQRLIQQLTPFLLLGIAIVAVAFGLILFAYLFLIGAIVGLIMFTINWVRKTFFTPDITPLKKPTHPSGRIIDADDWDSDSR